MEIYQIHWPFGSLSSRYWDGLADCVEQGLVKVIYFLSTTYINRRKYFIKFRNMLPFFIDVVAARREGYQRSVLDQAIGKVRPLDL